MEINDKPFKGHGFHLAGIVPCAGQPLEYGMEWPDFMMPVAPNYTMLEAAILECAYAGCDTIWLCMHHDTARFVRQRIGDFVQDPVWIHRKHEAFPSEHKIRIPIYYVPVHPKDRDRRDCLSWSVIYGALNAFKVSANISKWLIPDKYFVSFPYGLYNPMILRQHRKSISSSRNFYVTYNSMSAENNLPISFTFGKDEFVRFRRQIRKGTGEFKNVVEDGKLAPTERLPLEERYSARWFDIKDVFFDLDVNNENSISTPVFFDLRSWQQYKKYLSSDLSEVIKRPKHMKYSEFNRIGVDNSK
tara:strand:- start:3260 stop:4165 length:906 start_codon:yes stop_codon:yes gene_type:complete